jgi:hypothetical protein
MLQRNRRQLDGSIPTKIYRAMKQTLRWSVKLRCA